MKKEYLIEETSMDYKERNVFNEDNSNQMPKGLRLITKKALSMPLGKIKFLSDVNNDNILLDVPVVFSPPLKNLVNMFVKKSFALNIGLEKIAEKFSYEKLVSIKKLFLKVDGFGEVSTSSKFAGIVCAFFTSESSLAQAVKKARAANILVNTNLKKSTVYLDWAVVLKEIPIGILAETVWAVLSEFGTIKSIKMQLTNYVDLIVVKWFILIGKNMARCAAVCFDSAKLLDAVIKTMSVLKSANMHWSYFIPTKCAKCENLNHISLGCAVGEKFFSGALPCRAFSEANKSRLVARTSTNHNHPKVAESEIIGANHLGFTKSLFQQYSQQLRLNNNYFPVESVFNFYVNNKITDCLRETVNIEATRENFYTELFQHTSLPRNYSFAPIIREINQTIERYTQQQFSITYADKGKERLQTPAVTLKQIQPFT
ncbi:hypothetical protein G9A89_022235 [Geosiphon pyriformis]|nr:hypothetical protein G9A89_022235 [Geosiphon pyriformis]